MLFGVNKKLIAGYIAIAIFMTGDGFELTFLSRFMVDQGFSAVQASMMPTIYGLVGAFAAWASGVVSELCGTKRVMIFGGVSWVVLQIILLGVAIPSGSYPFILTVYAIRGIGYPLLMYSFLVMITEVTDKRHLASAVGLFWAAFEIGIGVLGTYVPSAVIRAFGEYTTLWVAVPFAVVGTLVVVFCLKPTSDAKGKGMTGKEVGRELARGVTVIFQDHQVFLAVCARAICNFSLYGLPVIMPLYLASHTNGGGAWFEVTDWMVIWGTMNVITVFTNVMWGRIGDKHGWIRQMRWFGAGLCALGTLWFYYVPQFFGKSWPLMIVGAVILAFGFTAFVPMAAIFPALIPDHPGAAVSANNLASGLSTFGGPLIATLLIPVVGFGGVCWAYAIFYIIGSLLTWFIHPKQPGFDLNGRKLPEEQRRKELELEEAAFTAAQPA
ncbi:MFS transporter [Bifidobacterium sp. 82T24]|uniref:MFS transporter n=1 Tax=Bifidobacterium pluvialisilvae TaxID=2834436 RepID=UPI001C5638CE|nr:MFS transporter [Bifidobacterium pluvialisilvae]MBW3087285.1 MFS transporter [Bifidobacterium pluvialisilvae]